MNLDIINSAIHEDHRWIVCSHIESALIYDAPLKFRPPSRYSHRTERALYETVEVLVAAGVLVWVYRPSCCVDESEHAVSVLDLDVAFLNPNLTQDELDALRVWLRLYES